MSDRRPARFAPVALLALLTCAARLAAQAGGTLDPAFGHGGQLQIDFNNSTDIAYAVALQPDGKLVLAGTTYTNNDYSKEDFAVSRHNPDGTPDPTFGNNGRVTTDFPGLAAVASSVVIQPDGKLLVAGGAFPNFTFLGDFVLVRYTATGALDPSFGNGGIVVTSFPGQGSYANDVALQPDGKIVAAGTDFVNFSTEESSNTDFAIARYTSSGALDTSFGNGGGVVTDFAGFNDDVFAIVVQPDGKLVAAGSAKDAATYYDFAVARYLANGALDASFGSGGKLRTDFGTGAFDRARAARLQPDGKLVAAGFAASSDLLFQPFALVRYTASGALDTSFSGDGKLEIDFGSFNQTAYDLLIQPDGKLVATGFPDTESSDSDFLLARCNPDGTLDAGFGIGGKVRTSFGNLNGGAYGAALQPDGKIVAVGFNANFDAQGVQFALARYFGGESPWVDLRSGLAGVAGVPTLTGSGTLEAGTAGSLVLAAAAPSAPALLFVASSSTPAPFKCGQLVPVPVLTQFFLPTNGSGSVPLAWGSWPGGLSGASLFFQYGIQDAAAVCGVALSNALRADIP
jgi:uncharacterized delta-60 repeat protein